MRVSAALVGLNVADCAYCSGYVEVASAVRVGGVMCNGQPQRLAAYPLVHVQ